MEKVQAKIMKEKGNEDKMLNVAMREYYKVIGMPEGRGGFDLFRKMEMWDLIFAYEDAIRKEHRINTEKKGGHHGAK